MSFYFLVFKSESIILLLIWIQQYIDNSYKGIRNRHEAKQIVNNFDFIVVASLGLHTYNDYYIQVHIH